MRTRFVKVIRDLRSDAPRNSMMVAAIAVGVLSVGTILGAYAVLTREMARNYLGTRPAHATLKVESDIPPELVTRVRALDGIADAERHTTILGRMRVGDDWFPILLFVVDDFRDVRTNAVTPLSGAWPPPTGTMLIERTARVTMKVGEGGEVIVKTPHGTPRAIGISGLVHDPGLAPAWQEQEGYGYLTLDTLHLLGESAGFDELRIRVRDEAQTEPIARRVAAFLQSEGYRVHEVQIPPPRRHPHQSQMQTVLTLFLAFSFATLILSAILVATSLATVMMRQVREIGVMKTIGARSTQIASLYLATQAAIAATATLIGVPLSRLTAAVMIGKIAELLNLRIADASIPWWVPAVQAISGLLIPIAAAVIPIWRGSAISVREALASYGVGGSAPRFRAGSLALRNVFRQRGRLVMSLALLAAGGALFMTALNVRKAWDANLQKIDRFRHYDVELRLASSIDAGAAIARVASVPGVTRAEAWQYFPTSFASDVPYDIARVYPDKGHGSFTILGVPRNTRIVDFPLLAGRWIRGGNDVVLNHTARGDRHVGDVIRLNVDGRITEWRIAGFVEDLGSTGATAYVDAASLGGAGTTNMLRVALANRGVAAAFRATRDIEAALGSSAHVNVSLPMALIRNAIGEHMAVLVTSLLALSVLMAIVGGFGLASTMSMNVLERTRELGVMRAIGATPSAVARIVVTEGFVIAAMSFAGAMLLAIALSAFMSRMIGTMSFRTPLPLTISGAGVVLWLAILAVGSAMATALPARRASRMTVREALAYA